MERKIIGFLILFVVTVTLFLLYKYRETTKLTPEQKKTQGAVEFINSYLNDDETQSDFTDKSKEESVVIGQDILWKEAKVFSKYLSLSIVEQTELNFNKAFESALRITKCVHTMSIIQTGGPLKSEKPKPKS